MKNISIYLLNGKIDRCIICPESMVTSQLKTDERYIEGIYDEVLYYINDGIVIKKTTPFNEYCIFNYDTKQWIDPRTNATQWPIIKSQRDALLVASDYTQLPDVPLSDKAAWATYRQELRDITTQPDPFNIIWPTPPQG